MADYYTNYLVHHGIKGQKWGVRRYQNADGSLTAAGRDRYNRAVNEANWAHRTAKRFTDAYDRKVSKRAHYDEEAIANRNAKIKKVAVAGAAVAGTALAAYGMYKFSQSPSGKMLISAGKQKFSESFSNAKNTAMRNIKNSNAYIAGKSYMDSVKLGARDLRDRARMEYQMDRDTLKLRGKLAGQAIKNATENARTNAKVRAENARNTLKEVGRVAGSVAEDAYGNARVKGSIAKNAIRNATSGIRDNARQTGYAIRNRVGDAYTRAAVGANIAKNAARNTASRISGNVTQRAYTVANNARDAINRFDNRQYSSLPNYSYLDDYRNRKRR